MRIKLLPLFIFISTISLVFTSCLGDDDETTYYIDATIRRFSLEDILIENETDTFTVQASSYTFSIDQDKGLVFNADSLPYGTDITKVGFSVSANGGIKLDLKDASGNDSTAYVVGNDSLDFTNPIKFTVYSYYGPAQKEYMVNVNVHQVVPDSMVWKQIKDSNFEGNTFGDSKQKAILFRDQIFVFADLEPQVKVTSLADLTSGANWTSLTEITGFETGERAIYSSVILFNNELYITTDKQQVYSSTDGTTWEKVSTTAQPTTFVAAFTNKLIGRNENKFIYATLLNEEIIWEESTNDIPQNFPTGKYAYTTTKLSTNDKIERISLVGEMPNATDTSTVVWSILSNESAWAGYESTNIYDCPKLQDISLISYDEHLYAFGGSAYSNGTAINPFQAFFTSRDYGKNWKEMKRNVMFPEEFHGQTTPYSYIVDANDFIWIMWNGDLGVWKGRINRLGFNK